MGTIKQTILIVEDDEGLLELISEKIESCGYQTALVQSAEKALDWLKVQTASLMILDYGLPDMNGKEVIAELKAKEINVPPFIVCTGQGDERVAVDMMKLGARDYIIKDSLFLEMIPLVVGWVAKVIENENKLKLTEQALIESAQFNKQIIESVQEGIIVCDHNLLCQVWNPYMEKLTGIPANEIIGKFPSDLFPFLQDSDPSEKLREAIRESLILEIETSIDLPVTGKSGWFTNTISTLSSAGGEVNGAIITVHDITERKRAEEALYDSEQRYRLLIETANEGILVVQNGVLKFVNPMMQELTGFTKEELLKFPFADFVHPEDKELLINDHLKRIKGEQDVPRCHYRLLNKGGSTKWIEMNGVKIEWEGKPATLNLLTDITERKSAEAVQQKITERLSLACRAGGIGIWELDVANNNLIWDEQMFKLYGSRPEEFKGTYETWRTGLLPDDLLKSEEELQMALQGSKDFNTEFRVVWPDGSIHSIRALADVQKDQSGQAVSLIGTNYDITGIKQLESEIILKNQELQKLNTEKDKFFSIIAHDLRSPFNSFLGLTQIMAEELPSLTLAEAQEIALGMSKSASNLYRLLENLLHWAGMQQGLTPFNQELIQLYPIVEECMAIMQDPAKNKGIKITYDIPVNLEVFADGNMLQTSIRNLVSNAVKFTHKGGEISVSAKATEDHSVEISVTDSGIGMGQEMVNNLFRIDVKTNRKGTEGEPSTGLGLLLCKEFVEKQGGKIWVESEEGKGTRFCFTVPKN